MKRILISDDCCVVCVREMERERENSMREIGGKRFNFVDEVKSQTWIATL